MKKQMELLSPAGNREAFDAAMACGADAVYLGYTAFGARSYAGNFDEAGLRDAVDTAHELGRRVYVTVNTLVKEKELSELRRVLSVLQDAHADAVLVQDFGVARLILEEFPELNLHASTQMTVHNRQGALLLRDLGFSRVVPARECSLAELKEIVSTGIETEVFGHGALCVCVSGQCLFSSMVGGRSGNRGKCAQPCRMAYRVNGGREGFYLSPRDLMLLDSIPLLLDAGISSLKLEGRMKRPEYVAAVTLAYRRAIDAAEAGNRFRIDESLREEILQIFNRGGFTHGYILGENHAALMGTDHAGHHGVPVGTVVRMEGNTAVLAATRPLHPQDSLQIRLRKDWDFSYNGKEAATGSQVRLHLPEGCRPAAGTEVFRLTDSAQIRTLRERIAAGCQQRIPLFAELRAIPGERVSLKLTDPDGRMGEAVSNLPAEKAEQHPLSTQTARDKIGKLGGTPYELQELILTGEGAYLPIAELNSLRRNALEALRRKRIQALPIILRKPVILQREEAPKFAEKLVVSSGTPEMGAELLSAGADLFVLKADTLIPEELEDALRKCTARTFALELPALTFSRSLDELRAFVCRHTDRISAVLVNSVGQMGLNWPCVVLGGQGLNVMNSESARFCESFGVTAMTASCELNAKELRELIAGGGNFFLQAYGRQQLMLLSHCPVRTAAGDGESDDCCRRCDNRAGRPAVYTDRKGFRFPLQRIRRPEGCLLRLYNSVPTDMSSHWGAIADLPVGIRLDFWNETPERQKEITVSFRQLIKMGKATHIPEAQTTSGHLLRGVE